ncbi:twin-arginine translocation signal domain-containing protein [Agrobacterium rhizogenes]|nr:twin-arginine translocation signal domain-containing protein [Rhizobium rhizogenes]
MYRRDFLTGAAASTVSAGTAGAGELDELLGKLEVAVRRHFPDVKDYQVRIDPENKQIPLMIVAFNS